MIPAYVWPLANHLWQSTVFAAVAGLLTLALKKNHAQARHRIWMAASLKFLIPFTLLAGVGSRLGPSALPATPAPGLWFAIENISQPFTRPAAPALPHRPASNPVPGILFAVWGCGFLAVGCTWWVRWRRVGEAVRMASRLDSPYEIEVRSSATLLEPGVFGILRPVLLLPDGIGERLTTAQFEAILAHELCHVRRRDNLAAAIHMVVEAVFWFHPLVWWLGVRLIDERERACDEEVLRRGSEPEVYAEGILNVCKFYVESTLPCASGVSGADLRKRIEEIMTRRIPMRLTLVRKLMLAAAGIAALALPVAISILRAQTLPPAPAYTYEVVSIHPSAPGEQGSRIGPGAQGGMRAQNNTVIQLLTFAYDVRDYQFANAPGWVLSDRFDVSFTPDKPEVAPSPSMARDQLEGMFNRHRQRMQAVLRDRFGLVLRAETREQPIYALTVAKNGHKLAPPENISLGPGMTGNRGQITARGAYLKMLTDLLSSQLGHPVINETGLDGPYDFILKWTPEPRPDEPVQADADGTSIFTAIQEQLGLKLESKRGPAPVFVIEKIEKPSGN